MQLIPKPIMCKNKSIRLALAAASANLLTGVAQAEENTPWLVDSVLSVYSESDSRVTAVEPIVSLRKDMGDERLLALKFTFDALTGASPNGAIAANEAQTFTGPSGNETYTATAGETPLDTSFKDTRAAFNINWEQPLGERNRVSIGGNISKEYDFTSSAINSAFSRDFNNKNTTFSLGINVEKDSIAAVGGTPIALHYFLAGENEENKQVGSEQKTVTDFLFGVTQVMTRHWLTQMNFSFSNSQGYHTDPYKVLSVLNADGSLADNPLGTGNAYLYESRPDNRARQSFYWGNKVHLTQDVIDFSYRYYTDDWGINSQTLDFHYRYELSGNMYIEPHLRWYSQTAADFYRLYLNNGLEVVNGNAIIDYASADSRLGEFSGTTIGIKYGISLGRNSEFNIRFEQYQQSSTVNVPSGKPALQGLNLTPNLSAMMVLIGYSFEF
jgi:hypothetical protein